VWGGKKSVIILTILDGIEYSSGTSIYCSQMHHFPTPTVQFLCSLNKSYLNNSPHIYHLPIPSVLEDPQQKHINVSLYMEGLWIILIDKILILLLEYLIPLQQFMLTFLEELYFGLFT
jgi:hypothetical protein